MTPLLREVIAPKSGWAGVVRAGQRLRVVDVEGQQVVDMAVFDLGDPREKLSTSYSRTRQAPGSGPGGDGAYAALDRLTEGHVLMSNIGRPMMRIVAETQEPKGVHDTHHRMCNATMYELHGYHGRRGCLEILSEALSPYRLEAVDLPDTFDIHMNFAFDCEVGGWVVREPVSRPGDFIDFLAERDCIVGLSNCPCDVIIPVNAYRCTPVEVLLFER